MKKLLSNFIFDIIIAVALLALGIVMLPPIPIGEKILAILVALAAVVYLVFYVGRKFEYATGIYFVALIVELAVDSALAIMLVLHQFNIFPIGSVCQFVGLIMWVRGVVALLGERFSPRRLEKKYSLLLFLFYILLLSFGLWIFINPFITNTVLLWIFCVTCFIGALAFGFLAYLVAPKKNSNTKK